MVLTVGALLTSSGCAGARRCERAAPPVRLTLDGAGRLNEDTRDRSLPTHVRVYTLTSTSAIEAASFEDMWLRDEESLGETLHERREATVYPERRVVLVLDPGDEARFVAAMGLFREPAGTTWRAVYRLPEETRCGARGRPPDDPERLQLTATIEANSLRLRTAALGVKGPGSAGPGAKRERKRKRKRKRPSLRRAKPTRPPASPPTRPPSTPSPGATPPSSAPAPTPPTLPQAARSSNSTWWESRA